MSYLEPIQHEVLTWEGVTSGPHRFGGVEFKLDKFEIGHVHRGELLDIAFGKGIKEQLLLEKKAAPHHIYANSGWISFWIYSESDVENALWLLRLSYLNTYQKLRRRRNGEGALSINLEQELEALNLSGELKGILAKRFRNQ